MGDKNLLDAISEIGVAILTNMDEDKLSRQNRELLKNSKDLVASTKLFGVYANKFMDTVFKILQ